MKITTPITILVASVIIGFLAFGFLASYPLYKDCKENGIKFSDCSGESICEVECSKLNMEFFRYEFQSSFLGSGNEECRCIKNGEPYEIY